MVTVPFLVACRNWRWLPSWQSSHQPSRRASSTGDLRFRIARRYSTLKEIGGAVDTFHEADGGDLSAGGRNVMCNRSRKRRSLVRLSVWAALAAMYGTCCLAQTLAPAALTLQSVAVS